MKKPGPRQDYAAVLTFRALAQIDDQHDAKAPGGSGTTNTRQDVSAMITLQDKLSVPGAPIWAKMFLCVVIAFGFVLAVSALIGNGLMEIHTIGWVAGTSPNMSSAAFIGVFIAVGGASARVSNRAMRATGGAPQ